MENRRSIKPIIITIIILAVLAIGALIVYKIMNDEDVTNPGEIDNPIEENKSFASTIIVDTSLKQTSADKMEFRISIPVIKNLTGYSFQSSVNREIENNITPYLNEIQTVIDEETPDTAVYRYFVTYDRYDNQNYLSLVVNQNYQTGGIRSNMWKDTYNIDAYNNRTIYLKDLFKANVDFEEAIIKEINKQSEEKNYELVGGNGLSNLPEKQKFYIEDGKLTIYFDPAAIAPYVYGELNFKMPFTLDEDGYFKI